MKSSKVLIFTLALGIAAMLTTGCGGGRGGKATVESKNTTMTTTMGQELLDLDAAYQKGIINEQEYNDSKQAIMKRYKK